MATARATRSLVLVAGALLGAVPALAGNLFQLPLRWCPMDGTPAVLAPMGAPPGLGGAKEPDTDSVLWRRHERASDGVWIPGAGITFRSGITAEFMGKGNFPIVKDPCPPTNVAVCQTDNPSTAFVNELGLKCTPDAAGMSTFCGGSCATQACPASCTEGCPGGLGDLFGNPTAVTNESMLAQNACRAAWTQMGSTIASPVVVNIRRYVNTGGTPIGLAGWGGYTAYTSVTSLCASTPTGLKGAFGGWAIVSDNQLVSALPAVDGLLAHELGHVLFLGHGNGLDDNSSTNGAFDMDCDSTETLNAGLMSGDGNISPALTTRQRDRSKAVTEQYAGFTKDPPGVLIAGSTVADEKPDSPHDVTDAAIDIDWVVMIEDTAAQTTTFAHAVFGLIDNPGSAGSAQQYVVFADLDNDGTTGAAPADLGFSTGFSGAELVTRVVITCTDGCDVVPTVWRFQSGAFAEVSDPGIQADFRAAAGGEVTEPTSDVVTIGMPDAVRGPASAQVRLQAIAEQLPPPEIGEPSVLLDPIVLELDRAPDSPVGGFFQLLLLPPEFPVCAVTPDPVAPGARATVEASGLIENAMAKVFLGDQMVRGGMSDANGDVSLEIGVPIEAKAGPRLVTVGSVGTALTADCAVEVLPGPPLILTPEASVNELGQDHTVTASLRAAGTGAPVPGVQVSFAVAAGPNTGSSGTCTFDPLCRTDAQGMVFFTYKGDGGLGTDQIRASVGALTSNIARKFWDVDCNQNEVADTCDISCAGFVGECAAIVSCGESADANNDDVPDECNRPPDCSNAGAEPDELWPPNHKLKPVHVAGVTDLDGDPVSTTFTSIRQDEPLVGAGSGNTSPDGTGVGTDNARVRSERSGGGDGRVYRLGFRADDGRGGSCSGEVSVCVPHDMRPGHFCVDQGPLFDSTGVISKKKK